MLPSCLVFRKQSHSPTDLLVLLVVCRLLKWSASPACRRLALMLVCSSIVVTHCLLYQQCNVLQTRPGPRLQPHCPIRSVPSSSTALAVQLDFSRISCIGSQQVIRNTSLSKGPILSQTASQQTLLSVLFGQQVHSCCFSTCLSQFGLNPDPALSDLHTILLPHRLLVIPSLCRPACRHSTV